MLSQYLTTITNANTRDAAARDLYRFEQWLAEAGIELRALRPKQLVAYRTELARGLSASSVNRHLSSVKGYVRWAAREELIGAEVYAAVQSVEGLEVAETLPRPLSEREIDDLLCAPETATAEGLRDVALISLLVFSGVRISEALGLDVEDLRLEERAAYVFGKGSKERIVRFTARAAAAIAQYLLARGLPKDGPVFVNISGGRLSDRYFQRKLSEYGYRIGRPELHPHLLRHTFATMYLNRSDDLDAVQRQLGHSRPETTQRYTRLAVGRLSRIFDEAMEEKEAAPVSVLRLPVRKEVYG